MKIIAPLRSYVLVVYGQPDNTAEWVLLGRTLITPTGLRGYTSLNFGRNARKLRDGMLERVSEFQKEYEPASLAINVGNTQIDVAKYGAIKLKLYPMGVLSWFGL